MPAPNDCQDCDRCETRAQVVQHTPARKPYMIVIDVPSSSDESAGKLLTGGVGSLVGKILSACDISEEDVFITSSVRCAGKNILKKHREACKHYLFEDIDIVQPNVIITMGKASLESVLGISGVTLQRGSVFNLEVEEDYFIPVVPTFAAGSIFADYKNYEIIMNDITKARDVATGTTFKKEGTDVFVVKDLDDLQKAYDTLMQADMMAFDTETTGLNPFKPNADILCYSFSVKEGEAIVIPILGQWAAEIWNREDKEIVLEIVKEILENHVPKVAGNGKFDKRYIRKVHGIEVNNFFFDTQLGYSMIHEERPHGLDHLRTIFTTMRRYDSFKDNATPEEKEHIKQSGYVLYPADIRDQYAGADADTALRVAKKIVKLIRLESRGVKAAFSRL